MGKNKKLGTQTKKMVQPNDPRFYQLNLVPKVAKKQRTDDEKLKDRIMKMVKQKNPDTEVIKKGEITKVPRISTKMFFSYNTALGPPYNVLLDTNFINFSVQNKLDINKALMDCLYAKCNALVTDCVIAELEKLGPAFRVALRVAKDPQFTRIKCTHKGTYADDCIVERVTQHRCYIVGTCDRDLKRRIRKIPGVPIMYIKSRQYTIERLPDVDKLAPE